ncbi:MAG: saccharopine dehydrogenase NADP-binding domain-containing protein [Myxococcales bacterium]|nr:saccharopine dehydrogenase NADP-binding domain-containing protein [Myxococcales bacterium]
MQPERQFDVVLWGATGYTGRLVARALLERSDGMRIAIAGRHRERLERVRAEVGQPELTILVGDGLDRAFVDELAHEARVVCTTVGPYARYGRELLEACAFAGTHYCDLAGEVPWIRRMIDLCGPAAERTGARLVHCCGFDSIPADLGVLFMQELACEQLGGPCNHVRARVMDMRGGISGGTLASMQTLLDEARHDAEVHRLLLDPYALSPPGQYPRLDAVDAMFPWYDPDFGWTAPFAMSGTNTRIVRRSNALMGYRYGCDFRYEEALGTGDGAPGLAVATAVATATNSALYWMTLPPLRALTQWVQPRPGQGPSQEERATGRFTYALLGTRGRAQVRVTVSAEVDPGYAATARMFAESALCLAEDNGDAAVPGGSWTPASAMGNRLIRRLQQVGIRFQREVIRAR